MPIGPGGLDSNGIWQFGEDDSEALASDLLNLGMGSVSTAISTLGGVLQVVSVTKTDTFSTTSREYANLTGLVAVITPISTSSKVLIFLSIQGTTDTEGTTVGGRAGMFRLTGGNSAAFVGDAAGDRTRAIGSFTQQDGSSDRTLGSSSGNYEDAPSTTSEITYQVQVMQPESGTLYINRSSIDSNTTLAPRGASTITLMEVAG